MNVVYIFIHGHPNKPARYLSWALYCLFFYPLFDIVSRDIPGFSFSKLVAESLVLASFFFITVSLMTERTYAHLKSFAFPIRILFVLMLLWGCVLVLRSVKPDFSTLNQLFTRSDGAGPWLLPVAAIAGARAASWRQLNSVFSAHAVLAALIGATIVLATSDADRMNSFQYLKTGVVYSWVFILVTWPYQQPKTRFFGLAATGLLCLITILSAKRYPLVSVAYFSFGAVYVCYRARTSLRGKLHLAFSLVFAACLILSSVYFLFTSSDVVASRYERFNSRLDEDTRTGVIAEFLMRTTGMDSIVGRGALGTYKTTLFREAEITQRENIENGYLQLIHKGGFILLGLFLAVALPAALLGIFDSQNGLTRGAGIVVMGRLIEMIPYGLPWTEPSYLLFWLCVGACLNKSMRRDTTLNLSLAQG